MIKKSLLVLMFFCFLCLTGFYGHEMAVAQSDGDSTPELQPTLEESDGPLRFNQLGYGRQTLQGGSGVARYNLNIPAHWALTDGVELTLDFQTFVSRSDEQFLTGGWLTVEFNGVVLDTIVLDRNSSQSITWSIPPEALVSTTGRYLLQVTLRGNRSCDPRRDVDAIVIIHPSSQFMLPHEIVTPPRNLHQLPYPIQQNSFLPDAAVLVIPDAPTTKEMQAAFTVAAAFGRIAPRLALPLMPLNMVTPEIRNTHHLVIVGQTGSFPELEDVPFPAPESAGLDATVSDGLIQMAISPWNNSKVVLFVGGQSDEAAVKAAQALAFGMLRTGSRPDVAVVEQVDPAQTAYSLLLGRTLDRDLTLGDLGYGMETLNGPGVARLDIEFFVPLGQALAAEELASVDLVFSHSKLLNYASSGLVVQLNDERVGSARLSDDTADQARTSVILPESAIRPGINQLSFIAELSPLRDCGSTGPESTWLTIHPLSAIHLPLAPQLEPAARATTLNQYPIPFSYEPTLSTTLFVLSPADPPSWGAAAQIASDLGRRVSGTVLDMKVAYADDVPEAILQTHNLLIVGRASNLPIVAELADHLPAPFAPGSDYVEDERLPITYRVPSDRSLGYLELLPAPWNPEHTIMAVLGNSAGGVQAATAALTSSAQRRKLTGNLIIVDGEQLFVPAFLPQVGMAEQTNATPASSEVISESLPIVMVATPTIVADQTATPPAAVTPVSDVFAAAATNAATTVRENRTAEEAPLSPARSLPSEVTVVDNAPSDWPILLFLATGSMALLVVGVYYWRRRFL